jgi:hypothetical protein
MTTSGYLLANGYTLRYLDGIKYYIPHEALRCNPTMKFKCYKEVENVLEIQIMSINRVITSITPTPTPTIPCRTTLDCSNSGNLDTCLRWVGNSCPCSLSIPSGVCSTRSNIAHAIKNGGRTCPAPATTKSIGCLGYNKTQCNKNKTTCKWRPDLNSCCQLPHNLYVTPSNEDHQSCSNSDPNLLAIIENYPQIVTQNIFKLSIHTDNDGNCNNPTNPAIPPITTPSCGNANSFQCNSVYTWSNFAKAVTLYNTYINGNLSAPQLFKNGNPETNVKILCALFSNTYKESNGYLSCRELLKSVGTTVCPAGDGTDCPSYDNRNKSSCCGPGSYVQKREAGGGRDHTECCDWSKYSCTGTDGETQCWRGKGITCKDAWNGDLTGADCFYGRGAIQLTYVSNYNKVNKMLQLIPLKEIYPGATEGTKINILQDPDSICNNGVIAWLSSIVYFANIAPLCNRWLSGTTSLTGGELALKCVKGDGGSATACSARELIYISYLKLLGIKPPSKIQYPCPPTPPQTM